MAEIKVGDGLANEINSLRNAGSKASGGKSAVNSASKLPTCEAYRQRFMAIQDIVASFGQLIAKDTKEIDAFVANMKKLDSY